MSRILAGLQRRVTALPRRQRWIAGGLATAVLVALAFSLYPSGSDTTPTPTAVRVDDRANRDFSRPTTTAVATPTSAATATPKPTPTKAKPAPVVTTTKPATQAPKPKPKATTAAPKAAGCKGYSGVKLTACNLLPSFGFSTGEMSALVPMWANESGWNYQAYNAGSGAFGIPQALPGSKMASAGSDWQTNPATQIKWGLGYIKSIYGSPSAAWSFWQANGWY